MDNRIILSKADFSSNNIGRIVDLDELTKKVLAKQTQYAEGSDESLYLNEFITESKNNGFLGKNGIIKHLFIPALANSYDELLYDIANIDGEGYPTNMMPTSELNAETKAITPCYKNTKIIGFSQYTVRNGISSEDFKSQRTIALDGLLDKGVPYPSLSIALYTSGLLGNDSIFKLGTGYALWLDSNKFGLWSETVSTAYNKVQLSGTGKGSVILSYDSNNGTFSCVSDSLSVSTPESQNTQSLVTSSTEDGNLFRIGSYIYNESKWMKYSMIAIGYGMSNTQMTAFHKSVNKLMSSLGINY